MRSIWIAVGRDPMFGVNTTAEHLYVFESSFDAHGFVNRTRKYAHLPIEARTLDWSVTEHVINESKIRALTDFNEIYEGGSENEDD
jgi:hypothetical protein